MAKLTDIIAYCEERLEMRGFVDFPGANNGLQFANDGNVKKIACAVDASSGVIDAAVQAGADLLLVHHGMFWTPQIPVTGTIYKKFKTLIDANLAVFSCHLPLDCHREIGHNALLAKALGLKILSWGLSYEGRTFAAVCDADGMDRELLKSRLKTLFPQTFKSIDCGNEKLSRIAILCGSGNTALTAMHELGCDTLVTGEVKHAVFAEAQEQGFNIYPCGHYATETLGIRALAEEVAKTFEIPQIFIPEDCVL
ncbi:MAG: Nif3-like dinuclear metal center hexameric protein [Opitutales bacterium]|nr:Nif3-like dinuclear metal center hexameric protein [Opitutales bacterium]